MRFLAPSTSACMYCLSLAVVYLRGVPALSPGEMVETQFSLDDLNSRAHRQTGELWEAAQIITQTKSTAIAGKQIQVRCTSCPLRHCMAYMHVCHHVVSSSCPCLLMHLRGVPELFTSARWMRWQRCNVALTSALSAQMRCVACAIDGL